MSELIKEKIIYLRNLKGKIYKILPLYEGENGILVSKIYCDGLLMNINSANQIFEGIFVEILIKLNEINFTTMNHYNIRKIILEAVNMSERMLKEL